MSHLSDDEAHLDAPSEAGTSPQSEGDVIAGVVDDQAAVGAVMQALASAGIEPDAVRVFSGEAGSEEMGHVGGEGVGGAVRRAVADYVGGAKDFTDRHREEALRGHHVMIIPLTNVVTADRVSQILGAHGGHDIVGKFGDQYEAISDIPRSSAA